MENKLGQEPAYPQPPLKTNSGEIVFVDGMSKRFYAACAAMQGSLSSGKSYTVGDIPVLIKASYLCADELLKQENES